MVRLHFGISIECKLRFRCNCFYIHLNKRVITYECPTNGSNRTVWTLFVFDWNDWFHIALWKLFFLIIVTWNYNYLILFVTRKKMRGKLLLLLLIIILIWVFHISVSWWSFTGDWVTASPLKSPGLLSVFWTFSIMMLFGYSLRAFYTSVSGWFLTGVWVTAGPLNFPGLFLVF